VSAVGPPSDRTPHEPSEPRPATKNVMASLRLVASGPKRGAFAARPGRVAPAPTHDDYALVAGIRRGDATAAAALFAQYRGLVERTLVRILGFDSELADAAQETFIRALGSTRLLRDPQALPGWLIRIAVCTASDLIRRRRRRRWLQFFAEPQEIAQQASGLIFEGEPDLEARQALVAAQAILSNLPTDERIAFSLRRLEGMEIKDVARACGCSLATIKRRLARAEKRFLARAERYQALASWLGREGGIET
jgi:RNA polymerase sigma-70 factor (ECF subfamily)